jgi:hypothetical protein
VSQKANVQYLARWKWGGQIVICPPDGRLPGIVRQRPRRRLGFGGLSQATAAASRSCKNIACTGYRANELLNLGAVCRQRTQKVHNCTRKLCQPTPVNATCVPLRIDACATPVQDCAAAVLGERLKQAWVMNLL